jgi:type IX secretion system PorP/SprF family membrane protein
LKKLVLIAGVVAMAMGTVAQDIHFSQFLYSPLTLNPALTGNFQGRYRLGINFRQQWRSISAPFQTTVFWGDSRDFLNLKNVNLGASFYYDQAGTTQYNTLHFSVPLSYRIGISKDSIHSVNLGVQPSFNFQSINPSQITSDAQWNGRRYDGDLPNGENFDNTNFSYFDLALGLTYNMEYRKSQWYFGFSMYNLFQPERKFLAVSEAQIPRRYNAHVGGKVRLGEKWFATPGVVYSRQGKFNEIVFGSEINYVMNPSPYSYRVLFFGLWDRGVDAGITNLGMYYNYWRIALSYDVNYSPLRTASEYRGGWELSIIYILREILPKRVNYKYCPNYI